MATSKARKEKRKAQRQQSAIKENIAAQIGALALDSDSEIASAASTKPIKLACNPDIELRGVEGKGRGLFWCPADGRTLVEGEQLPFSEKIDKFSADDKLAGTTLMRLEPELIVPNEKSIQTRCHKCFSDDAKGSLPDLLRCSGCKVLRYCSTTCQKADSLSHQEECKALRSYQLNRDEKKSTASASQIKDPGMFIRCMARLIWERKRHDEDWWKRIESLLPHREETRSKPDFVTVPQHLAEYLCGVKSGQSVQITLGKMGLSIQDLCDLYARVLYASFDASCPMGTKLGMMVCTTAAMINHSCSPNAAVAYPNGPGRSNPLHIVCTHDTKPGGELNIIYGPTTLPYAQRQAILQEHYLFKCTCSLCTKTEEVIQGKRIWVDPREVVWCNRPKCKAEEKGWVATSVDLKPIGLCTNCKQPPLMDVASVQSILTEGRELLDQVVDLCKHRQFRDALSVAQPIMMKLTEIQPPSSHPLHSYLGHLAVALASCSDYSLDIQEKIKFHDEAIRFMMLSYSGLQTLKASTRTGHVGALTLFQLASLMLEEDAQKAMREWVKASLCKSTFLARPPSPTDFPPVGAARIQVGLSIMKKAFSHLKIVYGEEDDGGEVGKIMKREIEKWEGATAFAEHVKISPEECREARAKGIVM